ncbi:Hypothetical predicted protein, partial [Paramuricea clavata]
RKHTRAFDEVKKEVSSLGVLRYFDPDAETTIQTDASLKGLGAVLLQGGQPVCYASKALTEAEQRYSNIEREALGVVWGLERFHYFVYGKKCTVHTDHKPLETIFRKKLSSCPCRLQRFVLRALNSPVSHRLKSPSELLNSRKLRTTLPMAKRARVNNDTSIIKNELHRRQGQQALYYNRTTGPILKPFNEGEPVNIYDHHSKTWEPGTIIKPHLLWPPEHTSHISYVTDLCRKVGLFPQTRMHLLSKVTPRDFDFFTHFTKLPFNCTVKVVSSESHSPILVNWRRLQSSTESAELPKRSARKPQ